MDDTPVLEELLGPLRAEFHARRTNALVRTDAIVEALDRYTYQVELDVSRQIAVTHGLRQPRDRSDARKAAQALLSAVLALPELNENTTPTLTPPADEEEAPLSKTELPTEMPKSPYAAIARAVRVAPVVIIGGAPVRDRLKQLPAEVAKAIEWVDTRQKGTHAIGNLEKRIRDHRISALILLEGLVQHRHTDPLVSAARQANTPCAYAGKGGTLALTNALKEIEKALVTRKPLPAR